MVFIRKKGKYFVIVRTTKERKQVVVKHLGTIRKILDTYALAESMEKPKTGTHKATIRGDSSESNEIFTPKVP